jgi:asparagine N-glycosylation enzyme membrane subunit Stt3
MRSGRSGDSASLPAVHFSIVRTHEPDSIISPPESYFFGGVGLEIDHRFFFRAFLIALLGVFILGLFAWYFDIRSASIWFIILWVISPIVLVFLLLLTTVMAVIDRIGGQKVSSLKLASYLAITIISAIVVIMFLAQMFSGIP